MQNGVSVSVQSQRYSPLPSPSPLLYPLLAILSRHLTLHSQQGYFQVVPSTLAPVRQARAKGKRERPDQENGSGDGWGHRVPEEDDGENADREGGEAWDENGGGGSEPRRRVRCSGLLLVIVDKVVVLIVGLSSLFFF